MNTMIKANTFRNVCRFALNNVAVNFTHRGFSLSSSVLGNRKFTEKHEWVTVDGKVGTVGISDYAQEALGEIVFSQLPDVGSEVTQHSECGTLESVKAASDIYSPASGKVVEKNAELESQPSLINKSCYDKGWLFKLELSSPKQLNALMDEAAYAKYLKSIDK